MLGKELGKYSTIIVSGGARGIDSHGREGLLASQGMESLLWDVV